MVLISSKLASNLRVHRKKFGVKTTRTVKKFFMYVIQWFSASVYVLSRQSGRCTDGPNDFFSA